MEGRHDPLYYIPSIVELEKNVRKISSLRLRDFILAISSGATPSVKEEEKFYSDAVNGVPFIRVQNLSPTNELLLKDLRYINRETHQKYLNRSQIKGGNLLVKITGVGRMAVSGVVPESFEGNINQHLVVIKTKDYVTSETIATFLNTDIGEKLASRRATGGTRPALDYRALKSIPIVFKPEIVGVIKKAVTAKKAKEAEAKHLLDSVDMYLLERLGIAVPAASENEKSFFSRASKLSGTRFDPFYHKPEFENNIEVVKRGSYEPRPLKELVRRLVKGRLPKDDEKGGDIKVVQINSIRETGDIDTTDLLTAKDIFTPEQKMLRHDVLVVITGATIGKIAIWEKDARDYFLGGDIVKFQCLEYLNPYFVYAWLRSRNSQVEIKRNITGATNGHLSPEDVSNILVPFPPPVIQEEIATHIRSVRERAKELEHEAQAEVERAKAEVERMILGEVATDA